MLIEEYFVINAKLCHECYTLNGQNISKMYAAIIILFSPLILWFYYGRTIFHTLIFVTADGYFGISLIFICP